jgi:hypothetical protein
MQAQEGFRGLEDLLPSWFTHMALVGGLHSSLHGPFCRTMAHISLRNIGWLSPGPVIQKRLKQKCIVYYDQPRSLPFTRDGPFSVGEVLRDMDPQRWGPLAILELD